MAGLAVHDGFGTGGKRKGKGRKSSRKRGRK